MSCYRCGGVSPVGSIVVSLRSFLCKEIVVHFLLKNELNLLYPGTMIERNIISEQGSQGSI